MLLPVFCGHYTVFFSFLNICKLTQTCVLMIDALVKTHTHTLCKTLMSCLRQGWPPQYSLCKVSVVTAWSVSCCLAAGLVMPSFQGLGQRREHLFIFFVLGISCQSMTESMLPGFHLHVVTGSLRVQPDRCALSDHSPASLPDLRYCSCSFYAVFGNGADLYGYFLFAR